MRALDRRLSRLETPTGNAPALEDWLDVLDAADPEAAFADLSARFPGPYSAPYLEALDRVT